MFVVLFGLWISSVLCECDRCKAKFMSKKTVIDGFRLLGLSVAIPTLKITTTKFSTHGALFGEEEGI